MSYFREQAKLYAEYRPDYPRELFEFIADVAPGRELVWDCATGNGQAATGLADFFARVIATDVSPEQIANARQRPRIEYRVASAEASGLEAATADAVVVTQALHWLKFEQFYAEVRRVLRGSGAFVATVYADPTLDDRACDRILQAYNKQTVGSFWPPERKFVDEWYRSIPFPFEPINVPQLTLEKNWNLQELAGYLRSWSATVRYTKAKEEDPVVAFEAEMRQHWAHPERPRQVRWPFVIFAGRVGPG